MYILLSNGFSFRYSGISGAVLYYIIKLVHSLFLVLIFSVKGNEVLDHLQAGGWDQGSIVLLRLEETAFMYTLAYHL